MLIRKVSILCGICIVALVLTTCDNQGVQTIQDSGTASPSPAMGKANNANSTITSSGEDLVALMDAVNAQVTESGLNYRAFKAEYITAVESQEVGTTVFAKDVGNKQLDFDFVPNDIRRVPWSGPVGGATDNITYGVDSFAPEASNLPLAVSEAAIDRAMDTWNVEKCSDIAVTKIPQPAGVNVGLAGGGVTVADINHGGWLSLDPNVLGVTITWVFVDADGVTDIDGNGKGDTAFRDIFYSSNYFWADDGSTNIDVETIALHEAGHGLSQGHFGKIFITNKNGKVHFSPRAVMNAIYAGPQRSLLGTDNGGHCSNWAEWPNN